MKRSKHTEKFMEKWETHRNKKALFLLIISLSWATGVGGLLFLLLFLAQLLTFSWFSLAVFMVVHTIAGIFMGIHIFKLNEEKYQQIQSMETEK